MSHSLTSLEPSQKRAATHAVFDGLFRACDLDSAFADVVGVDCRLRMYSAFYVVRSVCDAPNFHVDYVAPCGCEALTLITPLRD